MTFCQAGRVYTVANLPYRGSALTISYQIIKFPDDDAIESVPLVITIETGTTSRCRVTGDAGAVLYDTAEPAQRHAFQARNGAAYDIVLEPVPERRRDA